MSGVRDALAAMMLISAGKVAVHTVTGTVDTREFQAPDKNPDLGLVLLVYLVVLLCSTGQLLCDL